MPNETPMDEMLDNLVRDLHAATKGAGLECGVYVALHRLALVVADTREHARRRGSAYSAGIEDAAKASAEWSPADVRISIETVQRQIDALAKLGDDRAERMAERRRAAGVIENRRGSDVIATAAPGLTPTIMLDDAARALGWRTDFACGDSPITWDLVLEEIRKRERSDPAPQALRDLLRSRSPDPTTAAIQGVTERSAKLRRDLCAALGIEGIWTTDAALVEAAVEASSDLDDERSKVAALETRQQELLQTIVRVSQATPYPDEIKGWDAQRAKMVAEVGSLRATVANQSREMTRLTALFDGVRAAHQTAVAAWRAGDADRVLSLPPTRVEIVSWLLDQLTVTSATLANLRDERNNECEENAALRAKLERLEPVIKALHTWETTGSTHPADVPLLFALHDWQAAEGSALDAVDVPSQPDDPPDAIGPEIVDPETCLDCGGTLVPCDCREGCPGGMCSRPTCTTRGGPDGDVTEAVQHEAADVAVNEDPEIARGIGDDCRSQDDVIGVRPVIDA